MYQSQGTAIKIFDEGELYQYLEKRLTEMRSEIEDSDENYLLNVNETEFVKYLVDKYSIVVPKLHFDEKSVSSYEAAVEAERFPPDFDVRIGKSYKKPIIRYHIPFAGNEEILKLRPNPSIM